MSTPAQSTDEKAVRDGARRLLVKLICFAIVMLFAGLTSAYVVSTHITVRAKLRPDQ